ncbi:thiol:disulfide interchange protein DsbD 1 [Bisbaumannia pacifica]|uniref:Thiol:disulfide interchange protein DsbD 1 n=1 Tax=Bisbaumannia pacifica TaxID=77098 RepID=A0A510X8P6_9GAMM|nr:protein-disulfide reductase DsbD [Halomonas pacifica]GEK47812.1 thiol:disulfide interchange protein DsbD 1 [Halomonas pacifica]
MIRRLLPSLLLLLALVAGNAQAQWFSSDRQSDFLPVHEAFQASAWHDGQSLHVGFVAAEDYYLYRHRFAVESDTLALGEPALPPGEPMSDEFLGDVNVFFDRVVFTVPLEAAPVAGEVPFTLSFQGCALAGLCYPPERLEMTALPGSAPPAFADWTPDAAPSEAGAPSGVQSADGRFSELMSRASLPLALGLFFLAGLGLTFTPCVLPMIPILSSIIVGQNPGRGRAFVLSASYVAGMAATYALVGVLMGLFGAGLNLQARLQSAPVLIGFALLFVGFALAMFGVINLRTAPRLTARIQAWQTRAQRSGPVGLALAGALSVLVVSPCVSAPLAGALVFISTTGDAAMGGAALLALALGMGVPLLLVGTFGTTLMPHTGAWMEGVKTAFGLLLLGVAIWLVERLLPGPLALLLWAALAVATALALGALRLETHGWARLRQGAGLLVLAWGLALVLGAAQGGSDPLRPLVAMAPGERGNAIASEPDVVVRDLAALERALAGAGDTPVFVDVTADWCISCKQLERSVYPTPQVAEPLSAFHRVQVDVTESNGASRELLERFQLFGPPSLLFFAGGEEIREARIQGEVERDEFAGHLNQLLSWLESRQG